MYRRWCANVWRAYWSARSGVGRASRLLARTRSGETWLWEDDGACWREE